jgi:hypothetical protein
MDAVTTPLLNGAILALFTVILAWLGKARFDALDRRMDTIESRMDGMERRLEQIATDIAQLRSDLLQVALNQPRPQAG